MKPRLSAFLAAYTFERQLRVTVTVGILCLALFSFLVSSWQSTQRVRQDLIDQGARITESLARHSLLALLTASPENAEESVQATLAFPGVTSVEIIHGDGRVLLSRGKKAAVPAPRPVTLSAGTATVALFRTDDANNAVANSTLTSTNADGERKVSASVSLVATKTYIVKGHSGHASKQAWGVGYKVFPSI